MRLGITLGDVSGIGPEIAVKALLELSVRDGLECVVIGPEVHWAAWWRRLTGSPFRGGLTTSNGVRVRALDPGCPVAPEETPGSPASALAAVASLRIAAQLCRKRELDAIVTAPVNKASIVRAGVAFVGQTEFLAELAGGAEVAMMLLGCDDRERWLRVVLVTTHVPLRKVAESVTPDAIRRAIRLGGQACVQLGLPRARIGVCGLNPHAGEDGVLGTEDLDRIAPVVKAAAEAGFDVVGPLPADALFYRAFRGDFEVVLAMYHDQGLAPLKTIGFERGVNWTLGLPFVRTSPDHGTAYDIAGRDVANPCSMLAALGLAIQLVRRRTAA